METVQVLELLALSAVGLHLVMEVVARRMERAVAVVKIQGVTHVAVLRRNTRFLIEGQRPKIRRGWVSELHGQRCTLTLLSPGDYNFGAGDPQSSKAAEPNPLLWYWGSILVVAILTSLVLVFKPELRGSAVYVGMGLVLAVQFFAIMLVLYDNDRGILALRSGANLLLRRIDRVSDVIVRGAGGWHALHPGDGEECTAVRIRYPTVAGPSFYGSCGVTHDPDLTVNRAVLVPLGGGGVI
jgi:hypothetical protein